ncbi:hypothetical protein Tco_0892433 [Tanacetum coccineum]|uniref:Reverse transcriptase Ty1/copia-type domain-containing protein n=1 Tax=Tanacetum coccineum TaxID=301880 RepID=A0ABQ5C665_9ASTR
MNYKPVVAGNQTNGNAGTKENIDADQAGKKTLSSQEYILLSLLTYDQSLSKGSKDSPNDGFKPSGEEEKKDSKDPGNEDSKVPSTKELRINQERSKMSNSTNNINTASDGNNTNNVNTVSSIVNVASLEDNAAHENIVYRCYDDLNMPNLEEIAYSDDDEDVGAEAYMNNLNTFIHVSLIPTIRLHKDHPLEQIIGDIHSAPQTRRMTKSVTKHAMFIEPKKVWTLMDLPHGKRAIGTKWVYRNKKDERAIVIRNKARQQASTKNPIENFKAMVIDAKLKMLYVTYIEQNDRLMMYLTASRPDIMFVVCACAIFQVTPKVSHIYAVKRIFRYLKGCLEWNGTTAKDEIQVSAVRVTYYWKAKRTIEISQSSDPVSRCINETVIKEWEDRMEMAATTASSLEAEQDSGNINRTQSMATLNESLSQGTGSVLVYAAMHLLTAVRHKLMLLVITSYCWFWATTKAKTVNGEHRIQALVDKKKVIITKKSVRSDLMLEDAKGTECMPNDVIFEQLTLIGAKTTAWNEFSSTMASAIICLSTNQKFNFSKYIFDNTMKNLEGGVKFLMYPRFVQVFLNKQVKGMSKHKGIYVTPSHTKKIFANMKREGKGLSRRITHLFQTMMVQAPKDMGEDSADPTNSHSTPVITQTSSWLKRLKKVTLIDETQERNDEDLMFDTDVLNGDEVFEEPIVNAAKTTAEVVTTTSATTTVDEFTLAQTLIEIKSAKPKAVTTDATSITIAIAITRPKAKGIFFHDQEEQAHAFTQIVSSSQASQLPQEKDKAKGKMVAPKKPLKKKDQITLDEELALRLHAEEQAELERM